MRWTGNDRLRSWTVFSRRCAIFRFTCGRRRSTTWVLSQPWNGWRNITRRTLSQGVNFEHRGLERSLAPRAEDAAYRIVQEGLNNVARHAQTSEATLGLWVTDGVLRVQVEDHGVGFQRRDRPLHDGECRPARNARTHRGAQGDADRQLYTWRGSVLRVELPLDTT